MDGVIVDGGSGTAAARVSDGITTVTPKAATPPSLQKARSSTIFGQSTATKLRLANEKNALEKLERTKMQHKFDQNMKQKELRQANELSQELEQFPNCFDWSSMTIDQRSSLMQKWDLFLTGLLTYTALFTPYEVAFLKSAINPQFWVNRFVDFSFLADTVSNFFIPFKDREGQWVHDHHKIAVNYLQGWFIVDIVSCIPFDIIDIATEPADTDEGESSTKDMMRLTRMIRTTKLVRLTRVVMRMARASRLFKRWEAKVSINYALLSLYVLMLALAVWSHWAACIWGMVMDLDVHSDWKTTFQYIDENNLTPSVKYYTCLQWSIGQVTAMGEELLVVHTDVQRTWGCLMNIANGVANAYLIGGVVGALERMNARRSDFLTSMDTLNAFLSKKKVATGDILLNGKKMSGQRLCEMLRTYYIFKHSYGSMEDDFDALLSECSPHIQTALALKQHSAHLTQLPYLRGASDGLVTALAKAFTSVVVAREEIVFGSSDLCCGMYWIEVGKILVKAGVKSKHEYFGEEVFYKGDEEVRGYAAIALTEAVLHFVSKDRLEQVVLRHGGTKMRLRMKGLRLMLHAFNATKRAAHHAVRKRDFHAGFEMLRDQYTDDCLLVTNSPIISMWKCRIVQILKQSAKSASELLAGGAGESDMRLRLKGEGSKLFAGTGNKFRVHALLIASEVYFDELEGHIALVNKASEQELDRRQQTAGISAVSSAISPLPFNGAGGGGTAAAAVQAVGAEGEGAAGMTVEWLVGDPGHFLEERDMRQYLPILQEHNVTLPALRLLSAADLAAIGVKLGDGAVLLHAARTVTKEVFKLDDVPMSSEANTPITSPPFGELKPLQSTHRHTVSEAPAQSDAMQILPSLNVLNGSG